MTLSETQMIHNIKEMFLTVLTWLMAFNPDPFVKGLAAIASIATIISAYSTYKKNKRS